MTPETSGRNRPHWTEHSWRRLALTIFFIGSLAGLGACASRPPVEPAPGQDTVYRSKHYVVYTSANKRSARDLASRFLGDPDKSWMIEEANPPERLQSGRAIVIPLVVRNKGGLTREGFQTVPVLTYHRFGDNCNSPLCMPADVFDRQMRYLKDNGFHTVTPDELLDFLHYRKPLPKKSVWITMDDGYRSTYSVAYPILKKYGFTATMFIYTEFVGASRLAVTWAQLKEMRASGFSIGSHTVTHSDLTKPRADESTDAFIARIRQEMRESKRIIDRKLGQNTFVLAYPFGYYDRRAVNLAHETGYQLAASVRRGGNPFFANPLALKRDQVLKRDMGTFKKRLITFYPLALE